MALVPLSLFDPAIRATPCQDLPPSGYPLQLELPWPARTTNQFLGIGAGSLFVHFLVFLLALRLETFVGPHLAEPKHSVNYTPLYFPTELITQRAPNKGKVSKQIDLASLMATQHEQEAREASASPTAKHFTLPQHGGSPLGGSQTPQKQQILPDAPALAMNQTPQDPTAGAMSKLPPAPVATPPSPLPTKQIESVPTPPQSGLTGAVGEQHAAIELKSDPQGADFKPYLTRILTIVRGNWQRITPEAVLRGRMRGRTVIEFTIGRDGHVNNVSIIEPSGISQLDLVSGSSLSMSNPLPGLPADFRGMQIRLRFTFNYAMPQ